MSEFRARYSAFLILFSLLFFYGVTLTRVNGDVKTPLKEDGTEQGPSLVKRAVAYMGVARRMQSVKSWIKLAWVSIRSPESWYQKGGVKETQVHPVEWAFGIPGFTKWWDTIKAKLASSNLQGRIDTDSNSAAGTGEVVKEAATKSFQTSKGTVQDAASSAAEVAGDAVKKTKEKVKKTASAKTEL